MGPCSAATRILVPRKPVACGEGADVEKVRWSRGKERRASNRKFQWGTVCMGQLSTNVSGLHLGIAKLQNSKLYDDSNKSTEGQSNGAWCQTFASPAMIIGRPTEWWMRVALDEITPGGEFDRNSNVGCVEQMNAPRTTKADCGGHCAFHYAQEMLLRAQAAPGPSQWKE